MLITGLPLLFKTKIQGQFKVFAYILPRNQGFCTFSRFYKLSNITIITIFFSHDRLSQRYTSTSTLSKMNFTQLYHNARDTFIYKRLYSHSKRFRACSNSHTVFSFFLTSCKHAVATETADKSWFLSALIIHASTCFLRKSTDSCSFTFFDFPTSISCNLSTSLQWDISILLVRIDLFQITFVSLWSQQTTFAEIPRYGKLTNWTLLLFQAFENKPLWHNWLLLHVIINGQLVNQKSAFDKVLAMRKNEDFFANMSKILELWPNIFPKKNIQPFLLRIIGKKNFTVLLYSYALKWVILKFCIIRNFRAYLIECAQVVSKFLES